MIKQDELKGKVSQLDKLVGNRLKKRRMLLGLSQNDLALAVGVSIQQVQKYEQATNRIACVTLYNFARLLRVPLDYFFQKSNERNTGAMLAESQAKYTTQQSDITNERQVVSLIKAFTDIQNEQSRKKILELVKTMS